MILASGCITLSWSHLQSSAGMSENLQALVTRLFLEILKLASDVAILAFWDMQVMAIDTGAHAV